jgi:hypothetical protein
MPRRMHTEWISMKYAFNELGIYTAARMFGIHIIIMYRGRDIDYTKSA